jgi:catechol 2,3-dioxygenase-like lactoylglutathione lyase family enzyme
MEPTLDHVCINVTDFERSKAFYTAALAPLGIGLIMEFGKAAGFGRNGKPELWIGQGQTSYQSPEQVEVITPVHVCVKANSRADVDAFHRAALEAGAKDFGGPGLRPQYHASYYGAFVLDPDGHNLEAVIHGG